jgi:hypothetical protein
MARVTRRLSGLPKGMNVAIIVALVGMATGVTSLYITWRSTSEESALRLDAYPTASQTDISPQGLGVRTELVNESLRPVVIRSADLLLDGEVVSKASGWIGDAGLLERAASEPSRLTTSMRTFPIGLGAREGKSVVLMMDVWTPFVDASSDSDESAARGSFRQLTATLASLPTDRESDRLKVRLNHVPGGSHLYPVSAVSVPSSSVDAIETAGALLRRVPPQLWVVDLLTRGKGLRGITLRRRFAGADEVDLARLDIWNVRSPFHRTLVRPVVARQQTLFPLRKLARGNYIATVGVNNQVVAYKSFAVG